MQQPGFEHVVCSVHITMPGMLYSLPLNQSLGFWGLVGILLARVAKTVFITVLTIIVMISHPCHSEAAVTSSCMLPTLVMKNLATVEGES
ncbi:hypothetical protein H5410_018884 [Solanum commersonii]|uniref:Uncharacterized protein n=1 Tax=Solanum commersonii TaxID=4109 RepID=A0A9J6A4D9_SOLCO|nr:hypothetical protein H5410_018884 [Solanum commersonii]